MELFAGTDIWLARKKEYVPRPKYDPETARHYAIFDAKKHLGRIGKGDVEPSEEMIQERLLDPVTYGVRGTDAQEETYSARLAREAAEIEEYERIRRRRRERFARTYDTYDTYDSSDDTSDDTEYY